ncbi:MAG: NTF2-like N-terminal transpeptidase domain-containing protein [Dehalococcoidia bacterium]
MSHLFVRLALLAVTLLVASCTDGNRTTAVTPPADSATPSPKATPLEVAQRYFAAWQDGRYDAMYDLVSAASRQAIARDRFVARYEGIADEATIRAVRIEQGPLDAGGERVPFTVVYATGLWGDLREQNALPLVQDADGWRVQWSPALIFKDLKGANLVRRIVDAPKRGAILDRSGNPLAITGAVPTVGTAKNVLNSRLTVPDRNAFIVALSQKVGVPEEEIRRKVDDPAISEDLFIPLKTLPYTTPDATVSELENTPGVLVQRTPRRVYPNGAAAAHVVGYIALITAEQLQQLRGDGYSQGDLIGSLGLEGAFEKELSGQRGARLAIVTPEESVVTEMAKRPMKPAQDIVTTIDIGPTGGGAGAGRSHGQPRRARPAR